MKKTLIAAVSTALVSTAVYAETSHHSHEDHLISAPIGIMGDHVHEKGKWMTSYRYSTMRMEGNRDGTNSVSTQEVLNDFMVAPTKMTMQMHMFGLMYGLTDNITLAAMLPYTFMSMDHVNRMGASFTTKAEGVGDAKLSSIYNIYQSKDTIVNVNFGVSLPIGSIDERDSTPAGYVKLPYPMQLGSGTYDLLPGVTATKYIGNWSLGSQLSAIIRTGGNNDEGYQLGNQYKANVWASRSFSQSFQGSLRLEAMRWGDIEGRDAELNPMMVPTARTDLRGGKRADLLAGISYTPFDLSSQRFSVETGLPVYQDLDGPQLETDYKFIAGWQLTF